MLAAKMFDNSIASFSIGSIIFLSIFPESFNKDNQNFVSFADFKAM